MIQALPFFLATFYRLIEKGGCKLALTRRPLQVCHLERLLFSQGVLSRVLSLQVLSKEDG